jgi:hypothetical protein
VKGKVDGAECPTCHGTNHRTVPAIRALSFAPPPKDLLTQMFLDEFSKKNYCCLCGNYGVIDTRGKMFTPAGFECGDKVFCVCPNGRGWKNGGADLDKLPASAPPPATAQPRSEEGGGASDADIERVARALWHAAGCDRHSDFDKPSYPAGPDNIRNLARHAIAAYLTTVQQKEK